MKASDEGAKDRMCSWLIMGSMPCCYYTTHLLGSLASALYLFTLCECTIV